MLKEVRHDPAPCHRLAICTSFDRWHDDPCDCFVRGALSGVEKIRTGAKASFADTISGTDLIVGARSGSVQLLLYSVFRIGNATNNVTWQSYQDICGAP